MRALSVVTLVALSAVSVALSAPLEGTSTPCDTVVNPADRSLDPILRTFHRWREAIREGDLATVEALVTEDAEFWTQEQPPLRGRKAVRDAFARTLDRVTLDQAFECRELIVEGRLALARGVEVNRMEPREDGSPMVRRQRAFSVLREGADGVWRFHRGMTHAPPE